MSAIPLFTIEYRTASQVFEVDLPQLFVPQVAYRTSSHGIICLLSYYILSHRIILFLTSSTCPLLHDGAPLEAQTTAGKNGPNSFWKFGLPDASTCSKDFSVHCAWSFELGHQANEALSAFFQAPTTGVLRTPIT